MEPTHCYEIIERRTLCSGSVSQNSLLSYSEAVLQDSETHSPLRLSSDVSPFSSANDIIRGEHLDSLQHTQKSIAEEIKRLMEEQDSSYAEPPKPRKRQVRCTELKVLYFYI